jgi:putative hydrolase of the HAD superfamily
VLDWQDIDTVLLDMDGTLLDLHYDNHFWLEYVPQRYAEKHGIAFEQARDALFAKYKAVEGTLNWYCVDYWTEQLGMDIPLLKEEVQHLIAVHPDVVEFLSALQRAAKRAILVTNAHGKSLGLKMRRTQLGGHFERIVSSHDLGLPKEDARFWGKLRDHVNFEPGRTLLVDDSLPVLRSARTYGIAHLLAVYQPDTRRPPKDVAEFAAIWSFREVVPGGGRGE